eukprot:TRINITY_DN62093_c0_g1_i1.p1 TRINITY_DN62093_c0_g1~~TRINITY_DN62093_c0_g1_i1.p1  ORF type:complete len:157 (-),score=16.82 TRINITY_DN62093_c0_g1_i1:43-513(-)
MSLIVPDWRLLLRLGAQGVAKRPCVARLSSVADKERSGWSENTVPCSAHGAITSSFCDACYLGGKWKVPAETNLAPFAFCMTGEGQGLTYARCANAGISLFEAAQDLTLARTFPKVAAEHAILPYGIRRDDGTSDRLPEPRDFPLDVTRIVARARL